MARMAGRRLLCILSFILFSLPPAHGNTCSVTPPRHECRSSMAQHLHGMTAPRPGTSTVGHLHDTTPPRHGRDSSMARHHHGAGAAPPRHDTSTAQHHGAAPPLHGTSMARHHGGSLKSRPYGSRSRLRCFL
jgi:hypothetical protein